MSKVVWVGSEIEIEGGSRRSASGLGGVANNCHRLTTPKPAVREVGMDSE